MAAPTNKATLLEAIASRSDIVLALAVVAIIAVLVQESLADDLRQKGLTQASRFSWQQTAQATLDAYRRVSDQRPLTP